jgi:hypothetical protein
MDEPGGSRQNLGLAEVGQSAIIKTEESWKDGRRIEGSWRSRRWLKWGPKCEKCER